MVFRCLKRSYGSDVQASDGARLIGDEYSTSGSMGYGVELGLHWGSIGQKRIHWSQSSSPRIMAPIRRRWRGLMGGRWRVITNGLREGMGDGVQERSVRDPTEVQNRADETTWAPQRRMGGFLASWSRAETITISTPLFFNCPSTLAN